MKTKSSFEKTYFDVLLIDGPFDVDKVVMVAFNNSSENTTKKEIEDLAANVLGEVLNNGMVKTIGDGVFESIYSKENQNETENAKE